MLKGVCAFIVIFMLGFSAVTLAEEPPLRMTYNHNELIRLDRDAASVVVNNPDRVTVQLESPRLLVIIPHSTGMTSFRVMDGEGKTFMERDVIVSNLKKDYLRVRRMCQGSDATCANASYHYCPNGCYDITAAAKTTGSTPEAPASSGGDTPAAEAEPPTINGEPIETMIGPTDSCPEGYSPVAVPEDPTGQGRKCQQQ